jgi:hypothetical protein
MGADKREPLALARGRVCLLILSAATCAGVLLVARPFPTAGGEDFATVVPEGAFDMGNVEASCSARGLQTRSSPAVLLDTFLFHLEDQLLRLRVAELRPVVDAFVLYESGQVFSTGEVKPSRWAEIKGTVPSTMRHVLLPMADGDHTAFFREGECEWRGKRLLK